MSTIIILLHYKMAFHNLKWYVMFVLNMNNIGSDKLKNIVHDFSITKLYITYFSIKFSCVYNIYIYIAVYHYRQIHTASLINLLRVVGKKNSYS